MISSFDKVVPSGFDGFVARTPLTFRPWFLAELYASSKADFVILYPFELVHFIGTISALVLHFRSLSNLKL